MVRRRDDDDDDRPRKRRRERDDDDVEEERPRRAKKKGKSRLGLWIGLGVGGVALIGVVVLMIVLLSGGGGSAKFVGKWEKIDPKGPGAPFLEFTADGVFNIGSQEFMLRFGPYTVSGKTATATTSKTTNMSIQEKKIETIRATMTSDDELSVTYSSINDKYRRMK